MPKKRRILVVDDEYAIALTFKKSLEECGMYDVDIDTDPNHVIKEFRPYMYDLLLVDIRMPKINGFELYGHLSKIDKEFKICFITAFVLYYKSLKDFYPKIDARCFIKKPISIDDLQRHVKEELDR